MNIAAPLSGTIGTRQGWLGHLELEFSGNDSRTLLSRRMRSGPLSVQRPFYPEQGGMEVYILHPPGGVVGGDILEIEALVSADAKVLITTPGAAKLYRSGGETAEIINTLTVTGHLEWMPQENIFFNGACVRQRTHVALSPGAAFIGWEIHCLGRIASGETFSRGNLDLGINIVRNEYPLLVERLLINDTNLQSSSGLRGFPVCGTLYATPVDRGTLESAQSLQVNNVQEACGMTLMDDLLVVRYLGSNAASARDRFQRVWQRIRPTAIGREAVAPRIWST